MHQERRLAYPDVRDQLDALMKEFARRREQGEELSTELDALVDQVMAVKSRHPKPEGLSV